VIDRSFSTKYKVRQVGHISAVARKRKLIYLFGDVKNTDKPEHKQSMIAKGRLVEKTK
jgi:hypothetical protein